MLDLDPKMFETLLHYALGISAMFCSTRVVVALLQRRDRRNTEVVLDILHERITRLEQATEYIAGALAAPEEGARPFDTAVRPRTPLPLEAAPRPHRTPRPITPIA
jgi:hypothetical protein